MRCASCGFENQEGKKFCEECGTKLVRACPSCGAEVRPTAKFCGDCGTPLAEEEQRPAAKRRTDQGRTRARKTPRRTASTTAVQSRPTPPEAERRQLTVMFCDLVGSTALSAQLDPEELREVVRLYQKTCTEVIRRYDGQIAQHLGDGLLVYFGYPVAHEDDVQRAVRAGIEIIDALRASPLQHRQLPNPIQVRIGIHTGLVVIGEIGSSEKREILALGETPNIAARVQGVAEPDTVVMSTVTQRLVHGLFACQDLGPQTLKGISTPLTVYRVIGESAAQSRFEVAIGAGLTPLVGREEELSLLQRRWTQAKDGAGQVVLLSGEAGIGKSRLGQALKDQVLVEGAIRIEFRCSPYHQNSAFYPITDHLQRLLQFAREDSPATKLEKLQDTLSHYRFLQADTVPLVAALLSLPHPEGAPPLTVSPQKQKEKTYAALVAWIVEEAEKAAVYCTWEDLHWADPSTLEVLTLLLDHVPMRRLLALLTFRPEFTPPWGSRSHLSQLTLSRLGSAHVEAMVEGVTGGTALPSEVVQHIVAKTDGVPLFVEELTKAVIESGEFLGSDESEKRRVLHTIPITLHDSLMARLDRLGTAKEVAQLGATLGREFSYELLQAVASVEETVVQKGLAKLVEAELVYQHGLLPHAAYIFKHALIQDAAYQSLLKSTRQQYHQQIAQVLAERFPETRETQPELLAHHYTAAGFSAQAIPYWQQAGRRATQRSAYIEAVAHLTRGIELLQTLPDTSARVQQELSLQLVLNDALSTIKGYTAPEVEKTVLRARVLCQQLGETPQLVPMLVRLFLFYFIRGEVPTARELAEQLMRLAQSVPDPSLLAGAHTALGITLYYLGELTSARTHMEAAIALYDPQTPPRSTFHTTDPRVDRFSYASHILWHLGYPDQALKGSQEALTLAAGLSYPFGLTYATVRAALLYSFRWEGPLAREQAERGILLATEQGFPFWVAFGTMLRGWALAEQGQMEEGIAQMQQGLAAWRAMGADGGRPYFLGLLAEACGKAGQPGEGLVRLTEALAVVEKNKEHRHEAELYRLKGELTLQKSSVVSRQLSVTDPQPLTSDSQGEAEECFLKAIEVAQKQEAKSLELRATISLARLWQQQGKKTEAHQLLSEIYYWFTEGFDTKDLQEAKALLEELA